MAGERSSTVGVEVAGSGRNFGEGVQAAGSVCVVASKTTVSAAENETLNPSLLYSKPLKLAPLTPTVLTRRRTSISATNNSQLSATPSKRPPPISTLVNNPKVFSTDKTRKHFSASLAEQQTEEWKTGDLALMLARAEVANDLLFNDPKRVVIEHGSLQADQNILLSLTDVTSPTLARAPELSGIMAASISDNSSISSGVDGGAVLALAQTEDPVVATAEECVVHQTTAEEKNSYKVYPDGDERALPEFILNSQTMEEVDKITGAWEAALDTLADGGFWHSVINELDGLQRRAPLHLSAKIRAGVPAHVRGEVWQTLTQARSTYLQTVYTQLIQEYSPHERVIRRDLTRTFPKVPVFRSEGGTAQQRMFRILKAYSLYDAEVGYCQGLGFIIGPLIMSMGECEAFCVLVRLMETYDLRGMFTEDMAGLHLRLYQFQALATEIVPEVMAHLEQHGVLPAMYVPSWFLSLFAYTMPLSFVLRAMDVVMAERAPETIVRIGIALLQRNADAILRQIDFESAMGVLNSGLYDDERNVRDRPGFVLQEAARLGAVVTSARLVELEAQYCQEQGVPPRASVAARPSLSQSPPTANGLLPSPPTTNQAAIIKFLGWPWAKDSGGRASSDPHSTGHGVTPPPPNRWRFSSLGKAPPPQSAGTASNGSSSGSSSPAEAPSGGGHISPRTLELTQTQREQSRQLREQVLKSLQAQDNTPLTALGPAANQGQRPYEADEVKQRRVSTDSAESAAGSLAGSTGSVVGIKGSRAGDARMGDSSWRAQVLEPLQQQLHDARVTSNTHRDALAAQQADSETLRAELVVAKVERAALAEENERLRLQTRRAEADRARAQQAADDASQQSLRSEDALVAARLRLAEADEERSLLVRQLENLRDFIADAGSDDSIVSRARMLSVDTQADPTPATAKPGRFSMSTIASNWSAIRDAISSPRQQQRPAGESPSPRRSSVTVRCSTATAASDASSSSSVSPSVARRSTSSSKRHSAAAAIPMAMLHRSRTSPVLPSTASSADATSAAAAAEDSSK
ncbi:hypothetical protein H4R24_004811 [Coemansia sp. RSA 988]|nr:hypothetical protein H4R24_004811 [Coemansia sp. RSA 988]